MNKQLNDLVKKLVAQGIDATICKKPKCEQIKAI
ncbi:hypothetical protein J2S17_005083 [Cytobacillus purgationiresistens]|uniref:Uncharacterized protein n=1 Tax=Cytobacillus purgationiresistens TaxID=863449 RepID=A0ABU0APE3_9BACI|nr:hypothetical protein [Cytobacillus purgationiresistens]